MYEPYELAENFRKTRYVDDTQSTNKIVMFTLMAGFIVAMALASRL